MASPIISIENLGKKYLIRHQIGSRTYHSLRETIASGVQRHFRTLGSKAKRSKNSGREEFWAVRDISFDVQEGDVVGIIGRNGAGKSTLLKILSRITEPTAGCVRLRGRVASLLEVGTGFHPELTGRENIFLNGAILGMSRKEVARKFDEIVAFAEVDAFLDTPVKHYSSGMYTRLAFAVAAHLDPEILVVDEVLAVGDGEFQKKCLGKMGAVARSGRTVLFVSHNMSAVQRLCSHAVLLDRGRFVEHGPTGKVVSRYVNDLATGDVFERPAQADGRPTLVAGSIKTSDPETSEYQIDAMIAGEKGQRVSLDMRLTDASGGPVGFGSLGALASQEMIRLQQGRTSVTFSFSGQCLAAGTYFVSLDLTDPLITFYDRLEHCFTFDVVRPPQPGGTRVLPQAWGYGCFEIPIRRCENVTTPWKANASAAEIDN